MYILTYDYKISINELGKNIKSDSVTKINDFFEIHLPK